MPKEQKDKKKKKYKLILNSDEKCFGGTGAKMPGEISAKAVEADGKPYSLTMDLPPYGAMIFQF